MTRIVMTMALEPALDHALSPGAYRCLVLVRSLAGKARILRTLTCSLARQLNRCVNTIRTYRDQLVLAGYLSWSTDLRTGVTTIEVLSPIEPGASKQAKQLWPIEPTPASWRRRGAQFLAHINKKSTLNTFL